MLYSLMLDPLILRTEFEVVISGEVLIKMDSFQAVTDVLMGQCVDFQWICQAAIIEN